MKVNGKQEGTAKQLEIYLFVDPLAQTVGRLNLF